MLGVQQARIYKLRKATTSFVKRKKYQENS